MTPRYSTTHAKLRIAGAPGRNGTIRLAQMPDAYYTGEQLEQDAVQLHAMLRHVLPEPTWRNLCALCAAEQEQVTQ